MCGDNDESLSDRIGDASSVLLLTAPTRGYADEACVDLLTVTEPTTEDVLSITLTQSYDERLDTWQTYVGPFPAKAALINVGEPVRSTLTENDASSVLGINAVSVQTVASASDLTQLGITISECISRWDDDGNQTVVCFQSLTALSGEVDLQQLFQFLHVLIGRLVASDAVAHFHMDPTAHDQHIIETLQPLFDAVIERTDDETWGVHGQ